MLRRFIHAIDHLSRDVGHTFAWAAAVLVARDLHDDVDGRRDLLAHHLGRETDAGHGDHVLDAAERVLNGELLVPHWRFRQGFDLRAYFETAERPDLVMLVTGHEAVPYLRDGPVATGETFAAANRVFGDDFLGYVFWFN